MRLLLDTHFLSWMALAPGKVHRSEQALISRSDLFVSTVTIFELRMKWNKFERSRPRRNDLLDPVKALEHIAGHGIDLVPLTGDDCATLLDTPIAHHDPFDEMLMVHAQRIGAKLLTRDEKLLDHPLAISA